MHLSDSNLVPPFVETTIQTSRTPTPHSLVWDKLDSKSMDDGGPGRPTRFGPRDRFAASRDLFNLYS